MIHFKISCLNNGLAMCGSEWAVNEDGAAFHRLYYVYGGDTVYEDCLQKITLDASRLYLFPANKQYHIGHDPADPLRCLWFHFTISPMILNSTIVLNVSENLPLQFLLKSIENLITQDDYDKDLLELLLEGPLMMMSGVVRFSTLNDNRMEKVINYIQDNYQEKISNTCLCKVVGLDKYYFLRVFKKMFGISPQRYIANIKFTSAMGLLRSGETVFEVSSKSGFDNPKDFSRAFKKWLGMTPTDYKKGHYLRP